MDLFVVFVGEEVLLVFGFYVFGDYCELYVVVEGDDGVGDGGIVGIVGEVVDE